jgi:hypothetical protein
VQIAALTVIRTRMITANTTSEATSNLYFMQLVALNTVLAIPFTLWYMQGNSQRSWYTYFLCCATFIASIATYATATAARMRWTYPVLANTNQPRCGNIDPSSPCATQFSQNTANINGLIQPFASAFMVWLLLDQCWHRFLRQYCHRRPAVNAKLAALEAWFDADKAPQRAMRAVWILIKLHALVWFCMFLTSQVESFVELLRIGSIQQGWTIGQIVGIMIWAQPIFKFVQLDFAAYLVYIVIYPLTGSQATSAMPSPIAFRAGSRSNPMLP